MPLPFSFCKFIFIAPQQRYKLKFTNRKKQRKFIEKFVYFSEKRY